MTTSTTTTSPTFPLGGSYVSTTGAREHGTGTYVSGVTTRSIGEYVSAAIRVLTPRAYTDTEFRNVSRSTASVSVVTSSLRTVTGSLRTMSA